MAASYSCLSDPLPVCARASLRLSQQDEWPAPAARAEAPALALRSAACGVGVTSCRGCVSSLRAASTEGTGFGENQIRGGVGASSSKQPSGNLARVLLSWKDFWFSPVCMFLKRTTGHCFKMSPHICALLHLYFDLGSPPGRWQSARRAGSLLPCACSQPAVRPDCASPGQALLA